jgi:hypothetical protein
MNALSKAIKSFNSPTYKGANQEIATTTNRTPSSFAHSDKKWKEPASPAKSLFEPHQPYPKHLNSLNPVESQISLVTKRTITQAADNPADDPAAIVAEFKKANNLTDKDMVSLKLALRGSVIAPIFVATKPEHIDILAGVPVSTMKE